MVYLLGFGSQALQGADDRRYPDLQASYCLMKLHVALLYFGQLSDQSRHMTFNAVHFFRKTGLVLNEQHAGVTAEDARREPLPCGQDIPHPH